MIAAKFVCLAAVLAGIAAQQFAPTGLLCDFQKSPALGVRSAPAFTWIVPPCANAPDQAQTAYQIVVNQGPTGSLVWDSGKVASNDSTYVFYAGLQLNASTAYTWTVMTWSASCQSAWSTPATFITSLLAANWSPAARFISPAQSKSNVFGYMRKMVDFPAGLVSAVVHVTSLDDDRLLCGYKFYINDTLVNVGPGRGEAPVWGGDGVFRDLPYVTLDVTGFLTSGGPTVLAIQAMHTSQPTAILQLVAWVRGQAAPVLQVVTDGSWAGFNGDAHRVPGPALFGGSAGTAFLEYIDARAEPVGWREANFSLTAAWAPVSAQVPTADQMANFHPRMQPPMQVTEGLSLASITPVTAAGPQTCGIVPENQVLTLGCPGGVPIAAVTFASFGTPTGTCPDHLEHNPACDASSTLKIVQSACVGKSQCAITADRNVFGDPCYDVVKQLAVAIACPAPPPSPPSPPASPTSFLADFGREFQGGLRLDIVDGQPGQTVNISCGEALTSPTTVGYTWGWEFWWTLRSGAQTLEQHKYMECRFVALTFSGSAAPNFTLTAWQVNYPWDDADSAFESSNATLNAVWTLCRNTAHVVALDTYTDSNTRERTPYEADGMIFGTGRIMVQRDFLFTRHSHAFVIQNPTWPVEWQQLSPFLGWQDYMATGQVDLSLAFTQQMYDRTKISFLNTTNGLLNTEPMGQHIVDWMPNGQESDQTVALGEFTASPHMSVSNAFAAHGLDLLAQMMAVAGRTDNATLFAAQSAALTAAMFKYMFNGTAFCDGICSEVGGNSRVMSNMFTLAFGMVPAENVPSAWSTVANWGLENIGDYGAYWYLMALSSGYFAPHYDTPDDGTAVLTALTKCDTFSWCSGLLRDNLTLTRESWHDGTYSHGWGSSAIAGVVWGIMGIHQTAPGFAAFSIKPKLGSLASANLTIPTLRGFITVVAGPGAALQATVPCNTAATLCLPRSSTLQLTPAFSLLLDDALVPSVWVDGTLCVAQPVGCGAAGAPRQLRATQKANLD